MTQTDGPSTRPKTPYLWSRSVDYLVGCGMWTLPWLAAAAFFPTEGVLTGALLFHSLALICNNPHYAATIARAYRDKESIGEHRFYTVYGTALLGLIGLAAIIEPWLIPWIFTVYITWSPFHYTGQNYGIAAMFAGRQGQPLQSLERHLIRWGFFLSFGLWALGAHTGISPSTAFLSFGIPPSYAEWIRLPLLAGFFACFIVGLGSYTLRAGLRIASPLLALAVTQALWFTAPAMVELFGLTTTLTPAYFSSGALAFMHCAQYLWITAYVSRRESNLTKADSDKISFRAFLRYLVPLIVGGMILFVPGPWFLSRGIGLDFVSAFLLVTALVNIHHFMLDGVIWKLRDRHVAKVLGTADDPNEAIGSIQRLDLKKGSSPLAQPVLAGWWQRHYRAALWLGAGLTVLASVDLVYYGLQQKGLPDSAQSWARVLNPNDQRHFTRGAEAALARGDLDQALALAKEAAAQNPFGEGQFMVGSLLLQQGRTTEALQHYSIQESLIRPDLTTYLNVGILSAQAGDHDRAARNLLRAARLAPKNAEAQINAAEIFMELGRYMEAYTLYDRALDLMVPVPGEAFTEAQAARTLMVGYRTVQALQKAGRTTEAQQRLEVVEALARALGISPSPQSTP